MNWFLFHIILKPLSYVPLWLLYRLSDLVAPLLYHVVRYRRKVTRTNLVKSFPEKSLKEIKKLERQYYRHLSDLFVEAINGLSCSKSEVMRRYRIVNREVVNRYYEEGKSVVLMSAHHNNWEYMVLSINLQLRHHGIGVGKPLNNKGFGKYLHRARIRYGDEIVDQTNVRKVMAYYDQYHVPCAYMMLSDQSPSNAKKCFWADFLHQDTAFLYGAEHFSRKYNYAVLYYEVRKKKRGRYDVILSELCPDPSQAPEGSITLEYIKRLESLIQNQPQYWLWSHKRWKLDRNGRKKHYC